MLERLHTHSDQAVRIAQSESFTLGCQNVQAFALSIY